MKSPEIGVLVVPGGFDRAGNPLPRSYMRADAAAELWHGQKGPKPRVFATGGNICATIPDLIEASHTEDLLIANGVAAGCIEKLPGTYCSTGDGVALAKTGVEKLTIVTSTLHAEKFVRTLACLTGLPSDNFGVHAVDEGPSLNGMPPAEYYRTGFAILACLMDGLEPGKPGTITAVEQRLKDNVAAYGNPDALPRDDFEKQCVARVREQPGLLERLSLPIPADILQEV